MLYLPFHYLAADQPTQETDKDRGEVTHFPMPTTKKHRVTSSSTSSVHVPKDVTGDKREMMFMEQLSETDKKTAKEADHAKKLKKKQDKGTSVV